MLDEAIDEHFVVQLEAARQLYQLHAIAAALSFGLFGLLPLALNYRRRRQAGFTARSHHDWMIAAYTHFAIGALLGLFLLRLWLGLALLAAAWLWLACQLWKGHKALQAGEAMPKLRLKK